MLPRGLATSALLYALSHVLAPGVRGADFIIPPNPKYQEPDRTTTESHTTDTLAETTGNGYTVLEHSVTVMKEDDSVRLHSRSAATLSSSSAEWFTGHQKLEPGMSSCCKDKTSDAAAPTSSRVSMAGKSNDSREETTLIAEETSYESHSQPLSSLPARSQVDEGVTERFALPVSSHYSPESSPAMLQRSTALAPAEEVSLADSQATAFSGTGGYWPDRLELDISVSESIAAGISTVPYQNSSGFGAVAVLLETPKTELLTKTNGVPPVDNRPTDYSGTVALDVDSSTAHYELSSKNAGKAASLPETQSSTMHNTHGEVSSAVGFATSSPEVQVTKTRSIQYEQSNSAKVTVLSQSQEFTENYEPITRVDHTVSTSTFDIIELQTEHDKLKFDLDPSSSYKEIQAIDSSTMRHQQSHDESATDPTLQTRGPELFTNLDKRSFVGVLKTTLLPETSSVAAELASGWYPLLQNAGATTASQFTTLATESKTTRQDQSTSADFSASSLTPQEHRPLGRDGVMPLFFETGTIERSTERYVRSSSISETASTSASQSTEKSAEQSSKLDRTVLFAKTKATELPSAREDFSSGYLSIIHTYRTAFAPTKESSTSTSVFDTALAKPTSDIIITVLALVAGSVVLMLLIICGYLLVLAHRVGNTGSFLLPQRHSKDTDMKSSSALMHIGMNCKSSTSNNGCKNEAFV